MNSVIFGIPLWSIYQLFLIVVLVTLLISSYVWVCEILWDRCSDSLTALLLRFEWSIMYPIVESFGHSAVCAHYSWSLSSRPSLVYAIIIIIAISMYVDCIGYVIYFAGTQSSVNCSSHVQRLVSEWRASLNFFLCVRLCLDLHFIVCWRFRMSK